MTRLARHANSALLAVACDDLTIRMFDIEVRSGVQGAKSMPHQLIMCFPATKLLLTSMTSLQPLFTTIQAELHQHQPPRAHPAARLSAGDGAGAAV